MEVASHALDNKSNFHWENEESTTYASAPSSPIRVGLSSLPCYYSAPSSPTRGLAEDPSWVSDMDMPRYTRTSTADTIDFEFGISQSFDQGQLDQGQQPQKQEQQQKKVEEDPPTMAYADELFSNGQVLPSEPPPRLQLANNRSSSLSSPRSLSLAASGLSFKQKDHVVQPFGVALDNLRKEAEKMEMGAENSYRRSQSHSVTRTYYSDDAELNRMARHRNMEVGQPSSTQRSYSSRPERCASARHAVPTGVYIGPGPNTMMGMDSASGKVHKRWASFPEGSKREKIKNFLFRSASHGRAQPKDKMRDRTVAIRKGEDVASPSFESSPSESRSKEKKKKKKEIKDKEKEREKEMKLVKKNAAQGKPGLFVCMGYTSTKGMKHKQYMY